MGKEDQESTGYTVHYMDHVGSNSLFRGPMPMPPETLAFDYPGLKEAIKTAKGTPADFRVPEDFYLIDLNLLQIEDGKNTPMIAAEHQFFARNRTFGELHVWGMRGVAVNVTDPRLGDSRDCLAQHLDDWLDDRLVERVERIGAWLRDGSTSSPLPVVIYMHCLGGMDRTGELAGAYYLRYLNRSWSDVNAINKEICGHQGDATCPCDHPDVSDDTTFGSNNYRAVQWYCLFLSLRHHPLEWRQNFHAAGSDCRDGRDPPCTAGAPHGAR